MKKLVLFVFAVFATLGSFAKTGDTFNNNGIIYQVISMVNSDGEVAAVSLYDTTTENITIPASVSYDGIAYRVTSIAPGAFKNSTVKGVSLAAGIKTIESEAFMNCTQLTNITIPYSVDIIEDFAFNGCKNLTAVSIPTNIKFIGRQAFSHCEALTKVSLPNSLTNYGADVFLGCKALNTVELPDNMTMLKEGLFEKCENLNNIILPAALQFVDSYAFNGCEKITSVELKESVSGVGEYAFAGCKAITSINIPQSITGIPDGTFAYCSSLKSITLPNSVEAIGSGAFKYNQALTHITLPSWINTLGVGDNGGVFDRCDAITELTIPASVEHIGKIAEIPYGLKSIYIMGNEIPEGLQTMSNKNRMGEDITIYVKRSVYNSLYSSGEWQGFKVDYRIPIEMINAKGNTVKYKTLCRDFDVDLTHTNDELPEGMRKLSAYVVDDADGELGMVFMDEILYIPSRVKANVEGYMGEDEYVGIVVKGAPGYTYYYEIGENDYSKGVDGQWLLADAQAASKAAHAGSNMMKGAADAKFITTTEVNAETGETMTNYGVNNNAFRMISGPGWLGYNKSYLPLPENMANANLTMTFTDADGTVDTIDFVEFVENCDDGSAYDLQGRKVGDNVNGIIIQNGKKVVKK